MSVAQLCNAALSFWPAYMAYMARRRAWCYMVEKRVQKEGYYPITISCTYSERHAFPHLHGRRFHVEKELEEEKGKMKWLEKAIYYRELRQRHHLRRPGHPPGGGS